MKAEDVRLTHLLEGPKQFIVPVFQRDYSWGTKHCLQLWNDIIRIGADERAKAHFVGSVVYIAAEESSARITRWLLIDGQQRLTTLSLLLAALRNRIPSDEDDAATGGQTGLPSRAELNDYYLCNTHGTGDRRYKLHLRRNDQETLSALLDGNEEPKEYSQRIKENFDFFADRPSDADLEVVYRGLTKLVAVDVALTRGQDDPQMIFESLNSTGLDLTQADLIRNFVLMRQNEEAQTALYLSYWQPIEKSFGARYRTDFDKFVRDYLTLQLHPSKQFKADEIYKQFCTYFHGIGGADQIVQVLGSLRRFGVYYAAFVLGQEENPDLKEAFAHLRQLVEVATPVILRLYDCYHGANSLSLGEFVEAVTLLESYVFRRSVCAMQTRSLGQIFSSLASRMSDQNPLLSLKVALHRQGKRRRFPTDGEFREALETRDVYDMRNCFYLLDRLENHSKEQIDTATFTIEHVMPQNPDLGSDWRSMLGQDWKSIQEQWLHRLGNITLTGCNSKYSDRPFSEKKLIDGGFNDSPLRLNKFIREQQVWTPAEMENRGKYWAAKAVEIWPALSVDINAVKEAELEERKAHAAKYKLDALDFDADSRDFFDKLRPQILALGQDVVELSGANSITYRVFDFFVEVIPRKRRLLLVLNLDFDECDDPSQKAADATKNAFIVHATETGGVLFSIRERDDVKSAMHVIRQAYEAVSD